MAVPLHAVLLLAAVCSADDWGLPAVDLKLKRSQTAAAASATPYPIDPSRLRLSGCSESEAQTLRDGIGQAALLTANCLGINGKGLAQDLGRKIALMLEARAVSFTCGDKAAAGEGNTTFNPVTTFPDIAIAMRPPGDVAGRSAAGLGGEVFHEAIHAVDPKYEYLASAILHNKAFPDRVYACQLACEGRAVAGMRPKVALLERSLGREIPAGPVAAGGCGSPEDCGFLKKMSYICTLGGFQDIVPLEREYEDRYTQTICVAGKLLQEEPAPCRLKTCLDLRAEYERQTAKDGKPSPEWTSALYVRLYDVVMAARSRDDKKLSPDDKELLKGLGEAGTISGCRR